MMELIDRQLVIDKCKRLIEVEQKQGTDVMNYGRERVNSYDCILEFVESDYLVPTVKAISLDKVKQAREEIDSIVGSKGFDDYDYCSGLICARNILDKLLAENEKTTEEEINKTDDDLER